MILLPRIPHCLPSPPQHLSLSSLPPSGFSRSSSCSRPCAPSNAAGLPLRGGGARATSSVAKEQKRKKGSIKVGDQSEGGREELVRVLMRNFDGGKPLVSTLNKYVKVVRTEHCFMLFEELGKKDKWLQSLEVFRWMQRQRWYVADNGIYSKLISVMGKKGQTRMAMWLFSEMKNSGCRPDTSVYNALITAHLHSRDKSKALSKASAYFQKMKTIEKCKPNLVTYNILLRAYAQSKDIAQVEALFKDLDESTISADIYTYNGVMDAYGKGGQLKEMESVLSRMKSHQCKPDIITFNLLIDAYGKRQAFEKMEQVFKSLLRSKEKPTLPTLNSMIVNYGKARLREKVEFVLEMMQELGYTPSYITHESLIRAYGCCDCISKARGIFDEMMKPGKGMQVSSLNAMLEVYCMNGLPREADLLLDLACAKGMQPHASTYKLLFKAYTKADMKDLLDKLMTLMDKKGVVPNKKFFLEALGAFASTQANSKDSVKSTSKAAFQMSAKVT